jgi:hypothetical protein
MLALGRDGTYLATPDTRATITHAEHGTKTVRFDSEYIVDFYTLQRSTAHAIQRNTIALQLREKHPEGP